MEFLQDLSLQEIRAIVRILKRDLAEHFKDYQKLSKDDLISRILEKYDIDHDKLKQKGLIDFASIFVKREEKAKRKVESKERAKVKAVERRAKKKAEKSEKTKEPEKAKEYEEPVATAEPTTAPAAKEMEHLTEENKTIIEAKQITDNIHDKLTEIDENAKEILRLTHTKEQSHEVSNLIKVIDRLTADNNELRAKLESVLNENKKIEPVIKKSTAEIAVQTGDDMESSSSSESEAEPEPVKPKKEKRKEFEEVKPVKEPRKEIEPVMPVIAKLKNNFQNLPETFEKTKSELANQFLGIVFDIIKELKNPKAYDKAVDMLKVALGKDDEAMDSFTSSNYPIYADDLYSFYKKFNEKIPVSRKIMDNVFNGIGKRLMSVKREDIDDNELGDIIRSLLNGFNYHNNPFPDETGSPMKGSGRVFSEFWLSIVSEVLGYYAKNKK